MADDVTLLDIWPAWQRVWTRVADAPIEAQIDAWATEYSEGLTLCDIAGWPAADVRRRVREVLRQIANR
jgi:hypothetical protein